MAASARQIDSYLRSRGSPLAGQGSRFVTAGRRNGIDPYLLVAISGAESSFGKNVKAGTNNPFGWGPHIPFSSWGNAIDTVARGLRKGYFDEGRKTINAIGQKWAPGGAANDPTGLNSNWSKNVTQFYGELGGTGIRTSTGGSQGASGAPAASFSAPNLDQLALSQLSGQSSPTDNLRELALSVAQQQPQVAPGGRPDVSVTIKGKATPTAKAAVQLAHEYLGTPYVWGGEKPGGFDCSGLLQYVWGKRGVSIPRVTYDQWKTGAVVSRKNLQAGDAVFFRPGNRGPEHVAMYIGGGKMIEAPGRGKHVRVVPLRTSGYMGARRFG